MLFASCLIAFFCRFSIFHFCSFPQIQDLLHRSTQFSLRCTLVAFWTCPAFPTARRHGLLLSAEGSCLHNILLYAQMPDRLKKTCGIQTKLQARLGGTKPWDVPACQKAMSVFGDACFVLSKIVALGDGGVRGGKGPRSFPPAFGTYIASLTVAPSIGSSNLRYFHKATAMRLPTATIATFFILL